MDLNKRDFSSHVILTSLTLNSTTLYTYENYNLTHGLDNQNFSEIISQELGLINASKTLIGSIPVSTSRAVTNTNLLMYFMKKMLNNRDGSSDLITVIVIAHVKVSKTLVLTIMKKIVDKYIDFRTEGEDESERSDQVKTKLGEFKLFMNQVIKVEEMNFDSNANSHRYGAINGDGDDQTGENVDPNQLLLANEEVDEVRQLMLDNINKLMNRGDKINLLVDQTDRLTTSASTFRKRAQLIRRNMWLSKTKFVFILSGALLLMLYIFIGAECGYFFFSHCRN